MLIFSRHGLLPQLPDLSAAAGPLSRHLVVLFRDISQKSTGKLLPPYGLIQKQQTNFGSFFSHPIRGPPPCGAKRPYRRLVAPSTMGAQPNGSVKAFSRQWEWCDSSERKRSLFIAWTAIKNCVFFYPRNTSPTWLLLLFIMELVSAAKMGTHETTVTPAVICYTGYSNLTGTYE